MPTCTLSWDIRGMVTCGSAYVFLVSSFNLKRGVDKKTKIKKRGKYNLQPYLSFRGKPIVFLIYNNNSGALVM